MKMDGVIIVNGTVETDIKIINDSVEDHICSKCGHPFSISAGVILDEKLSIQGNVKTCPKCGQKLEVGGD
jgi:DNA-directed RNA polymerase subunit RPC12/RpoP